MSRVKHQNIVKLYGVVHNPVSSYTAYASRLFCTRENILDSDWLTTVQFYSNTVPNRINAKKKSK